MREKERKRALIPGSEHLCLLGGSGSVGDLYCTLKKRWHEERRGGEERGRERRGEEKRGEGRGGMRRGERMRKVLLG